MADSISLYDIPERRRRRRLYFVLLSTLFFIYLIFLAGSWLILRSPIFRIQQITIVGNNKVSSAEIADLLYARVLRGNWRYLKALLGFKNILIWPEKLTASDLIFLPTLKSLSVEKNYETRSMTVRVEERTAYGIWCLQEPLINVDKTQMNADSAQDQRQSASNPRSSASECWWFDDGGIIFSRAIGAEGGLILAVSDYSQNKLGLNIRVLPERFITNLFSIFKVLRASEFNIKEIRLNDLSLEELEVWTYDGPKLYFNLRFPADNSLAAIQDFVSKPGFSKLQYLDFRVENKVYYK
ncbi:MAG: hypothetical protein Q7R94_03070 [bacterium]|nr:hypothetical protein [bacterium]